MKPPLNNANLKSLGSINSKYIYDNIYSLIKLISFICAGLLLIAIANLFPAYYTFLRISVSLSVAAIIIIDIKKIHALWLIPFVVTALIFNPVIPVQFYKTAIWPPIYLATAALFASYAFKISKIKNTATTSLNDSLK